jgi:hypothetical protein
MFVVSEHASVCDVSGSGGGGGNGGSHTNYLYLSSETVFAVNRNLNTLTP